MKILCIGAQWRGANDAGFFKAFSQLGHEIDVVDEHYYINLTSRTILGKIVNRAVRLANVTEYNNEIIDQVNSFMPDLIFVYKGRWVKPATIEKIKDKGIRTVNFYPDVSLTAHGKYILNSIPLYDAVFSTKTFAKADCLKLFNYSKVYFIPHGFDPDIHRPLKNFQLEDHFKCDASFIGTFSKSKNDYLSYLVRQKPDLNLKIWGFGWEQSDSCLHKYWMHGRVTGDLYAKAIQSSLINIALLSEKVKGASAGDKITSRTFHIPANNAFMLHQRSEEIGEYFIEGKEIDCFSDPEELVRKVDHYLENRDDLYRVKEAGYYKCIQKHSILERAKLILEILRQL